MFRIFLAQQRSAPEVQMATELLQRWIAEPPPREELAGSVRDLLERLVRSTQLRFPAVGDLARSTRFRWFDQPLVDAERSSVLAGVRDEVAALAADPDAPDRTARLEALAAIPEQIVQFLAERLETGVPEREPMLEVLVRRHYREHDLHGLRSSVREGRTFAVADYVLDDRPTRVVSTVGTIAELSDPDSAMVTAVGDEVAAREAGDEAVLDLYVYWPDVPEAPEQASEELARIVGALPFAHDVRRVAVAVCPGEGRPVNYFTYRPLADGGIVEDDLVRGVHPMVGRRLDLWRLRDFHVTRIEAPEDVLLYECVARENPADRRLVALAQVRQLAVVRDEEGRVTGLPHAERAVENCLEAIRRVRASRGAAGSKLDTNHVWVQVWPIVEADVEQLTALQDKITPLTDGAGIEEVLAQGRVIGPDGNPTPIAIRFHARPGAGVTASIEGPPTERLKPLDEYAGKVVRARRRGLVYPYELAGVLTGPEGGFVEYDLDDMGALVPVDRSPGQNKAGILVAVVTTPTAAAPAGRDPGGALRRPDEGPGGRLGAGVLTDHRRHRPRGADAGAGGVVRALRGCPHLDGLRHGEHGLGRGRAQADHRVHPGRRRDQRRRRGHQRRGPAVLERRGDDAHAHQGHPGDDPGQRDGADRQAVARLLRRRVRRGQLRHRRLRPGDGPERSGAVLGARPGQRLRGADGSLRPHLRRAR